MKTVDRGYFADNAFNTFPELGLSNKLFLELGLAAGYNYLVGTAKDSLLTPAACELYEGHLDASAFLVAAQVELCQAGSVKPQPPIRHDPYMTHERAYNVGSNLPVGVDADKKIGHIATWRARRQTAAFMPAVRKTFTHSRLAIDHPAQDEARQSQIIRERLPIEFTRASQFALGLYRQYKLTYWDEACMTVEHGEFPPRTGAAQAVRELGKKYEIIRTGAMNVIQLSMVLDAARGTIQPSILRSPGLMHRLFDALKMDGAVLAVEVNHTRQARHTMQAEAQKALLGYVNRTQKSSKHSLRLMEDPQSREIAMFISEVDRFNMLGWVPHKHPNAKAVNLARSRRVWLASHINGQWKSLIPRHYRERALEISEPFRRNYQGLDRDE